MLEIEPGAEWARLRLGLHHLWLARPRQAISELQAALRMDPKSAEAWEALGAAYESVGRLQAALKVYERAVELDDSRVFSLTQVLFPRPHIQRFV
jgi:superkiller protein 3